MARTKTAQLNGKTITVAPIEQDLTDLEELRRDMQERVDAAHADGRVFMMQQYVLLLAQVTSTMNRIQARFNREMLADMRRTHSDLRAEVRAALADEDSK